MKRKETIYELAGVTLSVSDYTPATIFPVWKWKLDPWKKTVTNEEDGCSGRSDSSCDKHSINLVIGEQEAEKTVFSDDGNRLAGEEKRGLLSEERSGFFVNQIYRLAPDLLEFVFLEKAKNEIWLRFRYDQGKKEIHLMEDRTDTFGMLPFEYLRKILPFALLQENVLCLHGVLMEYEGNGIFITAPSETGKTTHARMWRDLEGALILNGDMAAFRKENGIWFGYGIPWSGTSGEQINRKVPLRAVIVLKRGKDNKVDSLKALEAFQKLVPQMQIANTERESYLMGIDLLNDLLMETTAAELYCTPEKEAVEVLKTYLFGAENE